MYTHNKVIWSEGMFLQQQHFQQYDRYIHHLYLNRPSVFKPYHFGIEKLVVDKQALGRGKYVLKDCRAILPDGTAVDIPEHDSAPLPLEIEEGTFDTLIYLGLPMQRSGSPDASHDKESYRYRIETIDVIDGIAGSNAQASVQIGRLCFKLLLEHEQREGYTCIPIARVQEVTSNQEVVLDERFIPPALCLGASKHLVNTVKDIENLLHYRASMLVERLKCAATGVAEITDFMLLQVINRYEPLLTYYRQSVVHPEQLYQFLLALSGELATFTHITRRLPDLPTYTHLDLEKTFGGMFSELRRALSVVLEESALSLPLDQKQENTWVTTLHDKSLINKATFVLAVYANVSSDKIRAEFPVQVKISPIEELRHLVTRALPGIDLEPLTTVPRQIPFRANGVYFALNHSHALWKNLNQSAAIAFHVGGVFPGLKLELWAVKG